MRRYVLLLCFGASITSTVVQADLKSKMSPDEFAAAGLHKLNADELAALSRWIETKQGTVVPAAKVPQISKQTPPVPNLTETQPSPPETPDASFGKEQVKKAPEPDVPQQITARIVGEFRGWDGKTVFRLDNGQVWQQRVGGRYRSPKRLDPDVDIYNGGFGFYLKTTDSSRSVGVKRLR
jgi:hypothetical protein